MNLFDTKLRAKAILNLSTLKKLKILRNSLEKLKLFFTSNYVIGWKFFEINNLGEMGF